MQLSPLLLSLLSIALPATKAAPVGKYDSVLKFPTELHNNPDLVQLLRKRGDSIITADTDIHQVLLTFPVSVGGENINAVVDTGSRSTWLYNAFTDKSSSLCQSNSCLTSSKDIDVSNDDYAIYYRGNFAASGKWATAPLSVQGSPDVSFKFGLADSIQGTSGGFSWAGFGYDSECSDVDNPTHIVDALKMGGAISKRVFEVIYDGVTDWNSDIMGHGSLTLGGFDASKGYKFYDMVSDMQYNLAMPMKSMSNSNGLSADLDSTKAVVFDTGSTNLLMKTEYKDQILKDIQFDSDYPGFFSCSKYKDYKLEFQVDDNTSISFPLTSLSWNSYADSYDLCQLMIADLADDAAFEIVFGQYALKNMNVVFDIDSRTIGLSSSIDGILS
jgi:hypothetical protein